MALGITDIVLLSLSLIASAGIGLYYGVRGLKSTPLEYLLGGRSMGPFPLAMSMMVGTISAITIMGNAGEMYAYGTQLWIMDVGLVAGMIFVAKIFIPIFYPLKVVSMYQYIEQRFHSKFLRQATVIVQLIGGYWFIGFLMYPPSIALEFFTGLPIIYNIFIMGITCTLYSSFGGVKAVVYADVFQSLIMLIGVLAIVIQGSMALGGLDVVWDIANRNGRIEFFNMDFNPFQRHSFWLCLTFGFFFGLTNYGVTQSQTQRCFSTSSLKQAQWVIYYAAIGVVVLKTVINLSGLVMFAIFSECDPITSPSNPVKDPSVVVVVYVLHVLTSIPGMAGLFVAAIYAAVLSSVSTQLNSMTALLWEDFLKNKPIFANWTEVKKGLLQKILVFASGILGIVLGLAVWKLGKSFLRTLFAITGAISGPQIGLFLVAIYLPWINVNGASFGFLLAFVFNCWITVGQLFTTTGAEFLPLSRDKCPGVNATTTTTMAPTTMASFVDDDIITSTSPAIVTMADDGNSMYDLSYTLNSVWGTLTCVVTAVIFSIITGTNSLDDVSESLINKSAWNLFKRFPSLRGIRPVISVFRSPASELPQSYQNEITISNGKGETGKGETGSIEEKEPLPLPNDIRGSHYDNYEADVDSRGAV